MCSFSCITPEVQRLVSFHETPFPNHRNVSISNSPAKLALAGFRRERDAVNDDVSCEDCGLVYGDWAGESPFAVHRVLREHCPLINTPSNIESISSHPRVVAARRRLRFPGDDAATDDETEDEYDDDSAGDRSNSEDEGSRVSQEFTSDSENSVANENHNSSVSDSASGNGNLGTLQLSHSHSHSSQSSFISVLSPQTQFSFPFEPKIGGFSMLFAGRRLKTFSDTRQPECIEWAEEGFVYRPDSGDVQCVFCAVVLPLHTCDARAAHAEKSMFCPRVQLKDVGNIPVELEERIRLKNLQRQLKKKSPQRSYTICFPQYEEFDVRLGTYDNWPHTSWDDHLHASVMSDAGFYFTGCADKVKCFSCGLGLYKWRQGSDPWEQHAHHMPTCPHLTIKGDHFIQQAAQAQVLTEADIPASPFASSPADSAGSPSVSMSSPPGSLTLDTCAVTAALSTSQYTWQQVRHAVLTYFCHTSRYPTKDILLGSLKAADENYTTLCQQRETIHQKDTVIQQTHTALKEKDTVIQEKDTVIQEKDTVIQEKDTALQEKDTVIQEKDSALQEHVGIVEQQNQDLQNKDQLILQHQQELEVQRAELEAKEEALRRQGEELERRRRQMSYQESQIHSLRIQMQALLEERRRQPAAPLAAPVVPLAADEGEDGPVMVDIRCKVCLSAESNTIFQPCHHISCCSRCAQQLPNRCPVCRAPIDNVLPAFIS